jgi:outer membrane protein assembly factor BamD (BamD/ComL family)
VGEAEADKFLYDRGNEFLLKKSWINAREYFRRIVDNYPRSIYREEAKLGILIGSAASALIGLAWLYTVGSRK